MWAKTSKSQWYDQGTRDEEERKGDKGARADWRRENMQIMLHLSVYNHKWGVWPYRDVWVVCKKIAEKQQDGWSSSMSNMQNDRKVLQIQESNIFVNDVKISLTEMSIVSYKRIYFIFADLNDNILLFLQSEYEHPLSYLLAT